MSKTSKNIIFTTKTFLNTTKSITTRNMLINTQNTPFSSKITKSLPKYVKILNKGVYIAVLTLDYVNTINGIQTRERQTGQILLGQDYGFSIQF